MEAARLVGALRSLRAARTNIAFFNQPEFHSCCMGTHRGGTEQLLHQSIERTFLRDTKQEVGGKIYIKPRVIAIVAGSFHNSINKSRRPDFQTKAGRKSERSKISPNFRTSLSGGKHLTIHELTNNVNIGTALD
jgi:hypothetical protein